MRDDCITIALGLPEVRVVREEETEAEITVEVGYRALNLKPIAFYLDGVQAEQTAIFNGQSLEITVTLDLSFPK